ncbi:MAG: efflux RND transporter permease subunit [Candidatus Omnitrophica bacterium]|nr:efflux RND transporter permease subunit [Candidatus Omnitrophota bacterium]
MFKKLIEFSVNKPKVIISLLVVLIFSALIKIPSIKVDTDPENMLSEKEFVRTFHHEVKKEFGLYDFIVLGVVNEKSADGVFTVETLNKVYDITNKIKNINGVISKEIISPSTKDNIRQGGIGEVVFEWLMKKPITTQSEADLIREEMLDNPMFKGTILSQDAKALCLYVPIERKDMSYRISNEIRNMLSDITGNEKYYITGLPVAEDTFGAEMFKQMAISAPLAGLIIFILMFYFFRNIRMIIPPMILAVSTIVITMGLLIALGFPVHIMSSMIPIFLMPIAVLDSVHILSEFFDKYPQFNDKKKTILYVMDELFVPMLFTSLTSIMGFFSLSFSPIPPVQVFGVFVALGIAIAWLFTITFIPAYISLVKEGSLSGFGHLAKSSGKKGLTDIFLGFLNRFVYSKYKYIVFFSIAVVGLSIYGITKIKVNDNPVKWFSKSHEIRIADKILNEHFDGTYTAYLILESQGVSKEIFKEPQMLEFVEGLKGYLLAKGQAGKVTALSDVVKKVYYELMSGDKKYYVIPKTKNAVSQCLISYENSHKPDDLWHMVTPDYSKLNIWIQLKEGDNRVMSDVVKQVDEYFRENQVPFKVKYDWAGLTYINVVWQDKMVKGMLFNFIGSFIIVFFIMVFLFRSVWLAGISMIPLTVTILFIYSLLGFFGKEYDMPVAVLSALTLGLSIDFAIHFIQRAKEIFLQTNSWEKTQMIMFTAPGRAIIRNALVVAIGFLPLLFAPLVPYKTVGFFMFMIMFVSGFATLLILPAVIMPFSDKIFKDDKPSIFCGCKACIVLSLIIGCSVIYILRGYTSVKWNISLISSFTVFLVMAGLCSGLSKSKLCMFKKGGGG